MSQVLNQEGRFKARPKSWIVEENKNTGTLQFVCAFGITAAFTGAEWEDWSEYDLEKTGYFYLSKKDGSPNETCIRGLRESLGWDGLSLEALQNSDWSRVTVQITTGFEDYNGQQRLKIKFINPEDWEGAQFKPLDQPALKSLNAKWGSKLRAVSPKPAANASGAPGTGTKPTANGPATPATATKPTAGAPGAPATGPKPTPPSKPSPPPPPVAPAQPPATRESAWEKVVGVFGGDTETASQQWAPLLAKVCPNKPEASFTAADWAAVTTRASEAIPF